MRFLKGLLLLLLCMGNVSADDIFSRGMLISTVDETVYLKPKTLLVTNGTLTDNGDGTATLKTGGGSGGISEDSVDALIYSNGGWRVGTDNSIYNFLGTNNVGIGSVNPRYKLEVDGDVYTDNSIYGGIFYGSAAGLYNIPSGSSTTSDGGLTYSEVMRLIATKE